MSIIHLNTDKTVCDFLDIDQCPHDTIVTSHDGEKCCSDCGLVIQIFDFKPEWKTADAFTSRCQFISSDNKSTIDPILNIIPSDDKKEVLEKYRILTEDKVYRSENRKALVAAVYFFHKKGALTHKQVCKLFGVDNSHFSDGISKYTSVFPESRLRRENEDVIIDEILEKIKQDYGHTLDCEKVKTIIHAMTRKNRNFKHAPVKNCALAVCYKLLCSKIKITKNSFAKNFGHTDASITKLLKSL